MVAQDRNQKQEASATAKTTAPSGDTSPWSTNPWSKKKALSCMGKAAMHYAQEYGWFVFPMEVGGTIPLTPGSDARATTDPDIIRMWWSHWPRANVGIGCELSKLVAIELVSYKDGLKAWPAVREKYGLDDNTTTIEVQGGNQWLLYRAPEGQSSSFGFLGTKLGPGVVAFTNRTSIALPPSMTYHGDKYVWKAGHSPNVCRLILLQPTRPIDLACSRAI